eukprot:gene23511-biopygen13373
MRLRGLAELVRNTCSLLEGTCRACPDCTKGGRQNSIRNSAGCSPQSQTQAQLQAQPHAPACIHLQPQPQAVQQVPQAKQQAWCNIRILGEGGSPPPRFVYYTMPAALSAVPAVLPATAAAVAAVTGNLEACAAARDLPGSPELL